LIVEAGFIGSADWCEISGCREPISWTWIATAERGRSASRKARVRGGGRAAWVGEVGVSNTARRSVVQARLTVGQSHGNRTRGETTRSELFEGDAMGARTSFVHTLEIPFELRAARVAASPKSACS
jgi:hypothetical protein